MRSIGKEEGVNAHVESTLMLKIEVANRCCSNSNCRSGGYTIEHSRDEDPIPGVAISSGNIGDSCYHISQQVDGSTTIDIGERDNDQGTDTSEDDIDGQLCGTKEKSVKVLTAFFFHVLEVSLRDVLLTVAYYHWAFVEYLPHRYKCRVDNGRAHRPQHSQPTDLQRDEKLEKRRPVLDSLLALPNTQHSFTKAAFRGGNPYQGVILVRRGLWDEGKAALVELQRRFLAGGWRLPDGRFQPHLALAYHGNLVLGRLALLRIHDA